MCWDTLSGMGAGKMPATFLMSCFKPLGSPLSDHATLPYLARTPPSPQHDIALPITKTGHHEMELSTLVPQTPTWIQNTPDTVDQPTKRSDERGNSTVKPRRRISRVVLLQGLLTWDERDLTRPKCAYEYAIALSAESSITDCFGGPVSEAPMMSGSGDQTPIGVVCRR